jgi:hypothetical protein
MSEIDLYVFCLLLGLAGLVGMVLSGAHHGNHDVHHGHAGAFRGHASHGHHAVHGSHAAHGHSAHSHANHHAHSAARDGVQAARQATSSTLLGLLSPRVFFSVLLGFGTTGVAANSFLNGMALMATSAAGGVLFEGAIVRPLWNFLMGFASQPARMLESRVLEEALAVTNFDADGRGLVSVEMNGEIVQLLARLRPEDRQQMTSSTRVRNGDKLLVVEVDAAHNTCVVTPMGGVPAN